MAHKEHDLNHKFGSQEPHSRNLASAGRPLGLSKNCGVAGCAMLIPVDQAGCGMHDFHRDVPHQYPVYPQVHTHFGGESHTVSFPTHVGAPESKKNKL